LFGNKKNLKNVKNVTKNVNKIFFTFMVDTTTMLVQSTRRSTLGDYGFPVAATQIRATCSLLTSLQETKSHLFRPAEI